MLVCLCWEIVLLKIFVQHFVRVHVSHVYALFCQREVNKVALNEV